MQKQTKLHCCSLGITGAPGEIRTHDLLIRSQDTLSKVTTGEKDKKMAEKEGFEPSRRLDLTPLAGAPLQPT